MDLTHKILSDYSYYLRIERAMSHNTVEAYSSDLESLFSYLGVEPAQVTTQDVLDYLAINNKISKRSQSRQLSAFRSFFDWLVMEGDRMDNPCDPIDTPKIGRYLPEVLSVEEVGAILDSVDLSKWTEGVLEIVEIVPVQPEIALYPGSGGVTDGVRILFHQPLADRSETFELIGLDEGYRGGTVHTALFVISVE